MKRALLILVAASFLLSGCSRLFPVGQTPAEIPPLIVEPPPPAAFETLARLDELIIPERDLNDLARRFKGLADVPEVARTEPAPYNVGDTAPFWYKDRNNNENVQIDATLIYRSEELNLWLEAGENVDETAVREAAAVIEQQILPTNRTFFGEEWRPGVDGDLRVNILHLADIGGSVVGYFSEADEHVSLVNPFSNERELLYISLKYAPVGSKAYYGVIAHEMQHMIHWHTDGNESTWLNEGLSELAAFQNQYAGDDFAASYAQLPDVQLNNFVYEGDAFGAHYGAAFLLTTYFLDRYGEQATRALVREPANSLASFDQTLADLGESSRFDDLFADWLAASYLDALDISQAPYYYNNFDLPELTPAATHDRFPTGAQATVNQYGADILEISHDQPLTFVFTGTQQVSLVSAGPHSGQYFWSSFPADASDATLTRAFDLSDLETATLTFWSWYDLEENWDYAYVAVSVDDGRSWEALPTGSTTLDNPQGNSYGPAYTGLSGDGSEPAWVQETADLSPYAGQTIWLRFEVVTDDAVHNEGFVIDDIAIPELNYYDDVENGVAGWETAGFIRHTNTLPQRFILQALLLRDNAVSVERWLFNDGHEGRWLLPFDEDLRKVVIIISGSTPVTAQPAVYHYQVR